MPSKRTAKKKVSSGPVKGFTIARFSELKSLSVEPESAEAPLIFPPTLEFMVSYCSKVENRPVHPNEVLANLINVRQTALRIVINQVYHSRANVSPYPSNKPAMQLTVFNVAVDIRTDLGGKGVNVPLT